MAHPRPTRLKEVVAQAGDSTPDITDVQARRAGVAVCAFARKTDSPHVVAAELIAMLGLGPEVPTEEAADLRACRWMRITQDRARPEKPKPHLVDAELPQASLCNNVNRPSDRWVPEADGDGERCQACQTSAGLRHVVVVR